MHFARSIIKHSIFLTTNINLIINKSIFVTTKAFPLKTLLTLALTFAFFFTLNAQLRFEKDFNLRQTGAKPEWLTTFDGRVFFSADDGLAGRELWTYDPDRDLTYQLGDINPGNFSSQPGELTVVGDELFFIAEAGNERQVWCIRAGATRAEQLFPDSVFARIQSLTHYEGALYFTSVGQGETPLNTQLHRYLPATETLELITANRGDYVMNGSFPVMQVHQAKLYFSAVDTTSGLTALLSYDVVLDTIAMINNQYTLNGQQVYVTDMRSYDDFLILNIRNPANLNRGYLGIYQPGTDSIFIDLNAELWTANPPGNRSIEVTGDKLYFRQRGDKTLLRTYAPDTRESQVIAGVNENLSVQYMQVIDEKLLYTTFTSFSRNGFEFWEVDPSTNIARSIGEFPTIQPALVGNFPGNTLNYFTRLDDAWYYQGFSARDNGELHQYNPTLDSNRQITNIHQGNVGSEPWLFQLAGNDNLLVRITEEGENRDDPQWVNYRIADHTYSRLLPEIEWTFYSKVVQLPGYLLAGQVVYNGVEYDAVAYDSASQSIIPIVESVNNCDGGFTRVPGTFLHYDGALYFTHCDGSNVQLYRHEFGVPGAEMVSAFNDLSLQKGSLTDETMGRLGNDLILPIGDNFDGLFTHDLYRFDGTDFTRIDLGRWKVREPSVVETPAAVYLSIRDSSSISSYFPAYLSQFDSFLHPITFQGDTIRGLFPLNFHRQDSTVYFMYNNQVLRHHPASEEASLHYAVPAPLNNVRQPYFFAGKLYFTANISSFGFDLYTVPDLTGQPERITGNIPGTFLSNFVNLTGVGERLFFAANDGLRGRELWSYQPGCFSIDLTAIASNINWPTGALTADPTGGTPPFAYAWNTGDTTSELSNLAAGFYEVTITDANGCSVSQNTWVETNGVISGTRTEGEEVYSAVVFPNPFRDQLTVRLDGAFPSTLVTRIFDLNGRQLLEQKNVATSEIAVDLAQWPVGVYILQVVSEAGDLVLVRRVIRE